jgi:hypothetical protein
MEVRDVFLEPEVLVRRAVRFAMPILVLVFLSVPRVGAAEGRCIQQTRYWGGDGPAQHLVVIDGFAFFGGATLRVADLADPTDPKVVHEVRLDDDAIDVEAKDHRIYVTDLSDQLTVIDAGVPAQAVVADRSWVEEPGWKLRELAIRGDRGVVSGQTDSAGPISRLYTLDLSGADPKPVVLGSVTIAGAVEALALGSGVAVAATTENRLFFIDTSNPTEPVVAAEFNASDWLVSGEVRYLEASGSLLAISDSEGRLNLVDISIASEPRYLSLIQGLNIGVVTVEFEGPMLHATGSTCTQLGVCGGYALINIAAPRSPNVVGRVGGPKMISPAPHVGYVVAAAFEAGLRVIDLRGLTNPAILDVVRPAREVGAIASADSVAHVVDVTSLAAPADPKRNVLRVLERSPDGSLAETASYGPDGEIWALAATGNYAAAAIYDEVDDFHSVEAVDVADPTAPRIGTRLGAEVSINFETGAPHLKMHGDRLYLSMKDSDKILIHDLSPGAVVRQAGKYSPSAGLVDFAVSSRELMAVAVRDGETGWIEIVDTRVPSAPMVASIFNLPAPADVPVSVEAEGSRLAVLCRDFDGLTGPYNYAILVDVSNPSNPVVTIESLTGGDWIAITSGVLHTIGPSPPPFPPQHYARDVTDPPNSSPADSLGFLEISRDRVDADGPYFCLSRNRLEVHRYGNCGPLAARLRPVSVAE